MKTCVNDLKPLKDIFDDIKPPKKVIAYTELDLEELRESIQLIITDFVDNNIELYKYEDFNERVYEHTNDIMMNLYDTLLNICENIDMHDYIMEGIHIYFNLIGVPRSYEKSITTTPKKKRDMLKHLDMLRNIPQPEQRTDEWFEFRWNRITASSAYKILDTQSNINQFIYSKCKPIDKAKYSKVNIKSATHHGHKYEEVSVIIYEDMYNTKIEEFGCIPSGNCYCIGASPDGINVKRNNPRFGRLLEIKNPVSRKITGIPKKAYWVQMQIQMFVTELYECDFLETSFKDYENEAEYLADGTFQKTADGKQKGIIVCFNNGKEPIYKYPPLNISQNNFNDWVDKIIEESNDLSWVYNTYWKLETISCILVPYNRKWMESMIPKFEEIWKVVLKERKTGYSHRKPKSRIKKPKEIKSDENVVVMKVSTESFSTSSL
jgi:hypothetical protein